MSNVCFYNSTLADLFLYFYPLFDVWWIFSGYDCETETEEDWTSFLCILSCSNKYSICPPRGFEISFKLGCLTAFQGLDHFLLFPWMKMWNFITDPPTRPREGEMEREKRGEERGGGWPGARCSLWRDTPPTTETRVRGHEGGSGARGGHALLAAGRPELWHELPARWAAALGMLEERSRIQWPSNAHTGSLSNNNTALCAAS